MRAPSPRAVDAALVAGVLAASVIEAALSPGVSGPRWAAALVGVAMSLLLLWRRSHPVAAAAAAIALAVPLAGFLVDPAQTIATFLPLLVLAYSGGAYAEQRWAVAALAVLAAGAVGVGVAGGSTGERLYFPPLLVLPCWLGGRYVRVRIRHAAELHETAALAAERREREAQQAVADERRRIAREMHDVVAHSISIMVVQAGGARRILVADPERAEQAAARIRGAGSDALAEMDILLGVLETPPPGTAPPALDDLEELVERARAAGLPVTLAVSGTRAALPSGAELAVYRVVQEALTNAIKHAGGASTRVELSWSDERLDLVVADDGRGGPSPQLAGAGHGLMGMRERLRVYGGDVESGPRPGGGFEVVARLPVRRRGAEVA
jgi:signal transduction histidine kinase